MAANDPETLNRATAQALNPLLKPPDTVLRSTFLSHPLNLRQLRASTNEGDYSGIETRTLNLAVSYRLADAARTVEPKGLGCRWPTLSAIGVPPCAG